VNADRTRRSLLLWWLLGCAAFLFLPWYTLEEGFFGFAWLHYYPADAEAGPAPWQALYFGRPWLWPVGLFLLLPAFALRTPRHHPRFARLLIACGALGLAYGLAQGYAVGPLGFSWGFLETLFGPCEIRQFGMGAGAVVVHVAFLFFLAQGLAARGWLRGDAFAVWSLLLVIAFVALFILLPLGTISLRALESESGDLSAHVFLSNLFSERVWGLGGGEEPLGTAWKSVLLGILTAGGSTALGLAFALLTTRTPFRGKRLLRPLGVLPLITPPFVIGLALILVFGRAGALSSFLETHLAVAPSRYIFGLPGVLLAQLLAFTPIAFLVLVGVVEGISPSLEEAAQTLRASRWRTFTSVTLPLLRPGLANAFLLGFIESLADFGNPLVLGGNYDVLATEIYFAIAGAQSDVARAAALALVLLLLTLCAFYAQRRWLGRKSYVTFTGKGDAGTPCPLPRSLDAAVRCFALPWAAFTVVIYGMILFGGFVHAWGRDHSFTLAHFRELFSITGAAGGTLSGLHWTGGAWDSLITTFAVAAISAPLTAALGLLTAWLLARQRFAGHGLFEFGTMLSFAIPGTVIGVAYILAFNAPPIELTGTGVILVLCFIFRNMPVGIRAGLAGFSQIDRSLDEASLTLGATSAHTMRRVTLPLLRPALITALIYGFVRAMTAISAVIFLVSADYDLATTYILGRVENGDYGPAIAYCGVLIVLMMVIIACMQRLVGRRELGRRAAEELL